MEFRHPSWYMHEVFRFLEAHRVALRLHDKEGSAIEEPFVGPFAYVRSTARAVATTAVIRRVNSTDGHVALAEYVRQGRAVGNAITLRSAIARCG